MTCPYCFSAFCKPGDHGELARAGTPAGCHVDDCPHGDPRECACERVFALWWLAAWRRRFASALQFDVALARVSFDRMSARRYALHRHEKASTARAREAFERAKR